ncbi:hypothetical protein CC86DRAFT_401413 [Ophiobolus disseminans]|uniref:Uncharacterized protein n=1 Tax=Ophiobolus disseminans TaxID=1469910 RepID=A0A6A7AH90_9PLEO|nr:hypothetical protein CC86DRAFT_401413 [Ophiobolus disseminans]
MAGDEKRAGNWFNTPKDSGESEYQDYNDYYDLDASLPIKKALAGLGVYTKTLREGGDNRCMQLEHENEVTIDGKKSTLTGAYFTTIFNPKDGMINVWGSYGARYMGSQQKSSVTVLSKLQSWSDIA